MRRKGSTVRSLLDPQERDRHRAFVDPVLPKRPCGRPNPLMSDHDQHAHSVVAARKLSHRSTLGSRSRLDSSRRCLKLHTRPCYTSCGGRLAARPMGLNRRECAGVQSPVAAKGKWMQTNASLLPRVLEARTMNAAIGDHLVINQRKLGQSRRRGEIIEILGSLFSPRQHFRVRWDDGHESIYIPGSGRRLSTRREPQESDDRGALRPGEQ